MKELKKKGYSIKCFYTDIQFSDMYNDIYNFCKIACKEIEMQQSKEKIDISHTIINMSFNNWENIKDCLLYRIYKQRKYSKGEGCLNFIYYNNKIIASGGAELWNKNAISLAKRSFVLAKHRKQNLITRMIIPNQLKWFYKRYKDIKILFTSYNTYLKNAVFKSILKLKNKEINCPGNFWTTWEIYPNVVIMNYVEQYLVYYCIDNYRTPEEIKKILEIKDAYESY